MAESSHAACKLLYVLYAGWSFHVGDGGGLVGVRLDATGADGCIKNEGEMPCVRDVHPLVGPAEGDGDLRPGAIARVGDDVFSSDDEHPPCGELPFPSALGRSEAPKMVATTLSWSWKALSLPLGGRRPLALLLVSSSSFLS